MELQKIKEFYNRTQIEHEPEKETFREIFGVYTPARMNKVKESHDWELLTTALAQVNRNILAKEMEKIQYKRLRAYSDLLDAGKDLIDDSESVSDKISAQENQRRNLELTIVEDTPTEEFGDALEGIIL